MQKQNLYLKMRMIILMKTIKHLLDIWDKLESEKTIGLSKRLYSSEIPFHIYGTYLYPDNYYGLAFSFNKDIHIDISSFHNLCELKVLLLSDSTFPESNILVIELIDSNNRDIFSTLCENLILTIISLSSEQKVIRTVVNQLEKWKALFEKSNTTGLSPIEQVGLYGELHFLHKLLSKPNSISIEVLHSWVGVDKALRDFQGKDWVIEVKTTSSNNPQKIIVNNERQLDETLCENLYVFHLSVEISTRKGQTLNEKIKTIREVLVTDLPSLSIFNTKLFETGFWDKHESFYQDRYYQVRSENYYRVNNNFPRIKENELRKGVFDVKYSIILSMCDEYLISENQMFSLLSV